MSDNLGQEFLLGTFDEQHMVLLKSLLKPEDFIAAVQNLADHSLKAHAELQYDMNAAVNAILRKFPGKNPLTVSEVHQTLRDLGIIDYDAGDFSYIESTLKRFGVLVKPDNV